MCFAEISSSVIVNGHITRSKPLLTVTSPFSSEVQQKHTVDHAQVQVGDPLLTLDTSIEKSKLDKLEGSINRLILEKNQLLEYLKHDETNGVFRSELFRIDARIDRAKEISDVISTSMSAKTISASVEGTVLVLADIEENTFLRKGTPLFAIVERDNKFLLRTYIPPQVLSKLVIGNKTRNVFSSLSTKDTPSIDGVISRINPIALFDELSGGYSYAIDIELDNLSDFETKWGSKIVEGLSAEVYLNVIETTPASYFLSNIKQSFANAWRN
jgi:multidrug resistance efflux pump